MRNSFLLILCCAIAWRGEILAENEYEVKNKGLFPFMAIVYYPDATVVDAAGNRFLHAAVLIKPDWLLSASIDHSMLDNVPLGFPRKTLLARLGALSFDYNFNLSEDEDEQEREVILLVKPTNHKKESWWTTDITLLRTLLSFKLTAAVAPTAINPKRTYDDNNCIILFYTKKFGSASDVRVLMQLGVERLPATVDNCGAHFSPSTMTCAKHDPADDMKSIYDPEFCLGNNGGPLLCEGEVMALQTYIDNNCKQPHLYQLLAPWDTLINCAIEQKCNINDACNVCTSISKDDTLGKSVQNYTQPENTHPWSNILPESSVAENSTSSDTSVQHKPKGNGSLTTELPEIDESTHRAFDNETVPPDVDTKEPDDEGTSSTTTTSSPKETQEPETEDIISSSLQTSSSSLSTFSEHFTTTQIVTLGTQNPVSSTSLSTMSPTANAKGLSWFAQDDNSIQRRVNDNSNMEYKATKLAIASSTLKPTRSTTKIRKWPKVAHAKVAKLKVKRPTPKSTTAGIMRDGQNEPHAHTVKLRKNPPKRPYRPHVFLNSTNSDVASNHPATQPHKFPKKKPEKPFSLIEKSSGDDGDMERHEPPSEALRVQLQTVDDDSSGSVRNNEIMFSLVVILPFFLCFV